MKPTHTVWIEVKCSERLPDKSDFYFTNRGYYLFEDGKWYDNAIRYIEVVEIRWWLEKQEDKYLLTKSQIDKLIEFGAMQYSKHGYIDLIEEEEFLNQK